MDPAGGVSFFPGGEERKKGVRDAADETMVKQTPWTGTDRPEANVILIRQDTARRTRGGTNDEQRKDPL
jgi:hypothetical protein